MAAHYVYDHGNVFSKSFVDDVLIPITKKPRGIGCLVIDGVPGTGKTTLAVHIADWIEGKPISLDFDNHPQLLMGGLNLIDQVMKISKLGYKVIIYDEAGELNRRRSMTKFNTTMIDFFDKCRQFEINIIMCLPYMGKLDAAIFETGIIDGLVHLNFPERREQDYVMYGVYDLEGIGYLRWYAEKNTKHPFKPYALSHPYMRGAFKNLPPERAEQLAAISKAGKESTIKKKREELLIMPPSRRGKRERTNA